MPKTPDVRLVERARGERLPVGMLLDQIDIETGAVPEATAAAARLFFRDDALRLAAGREAVAERIGKAARLALDTQNALGDLLGFRPDAGTALAAGRLAGAALGDLPANSNIRFASAGAAARDWPALPEGARIAGHGEHGPVVEGLADRPAEAIAWLRAARFGEVKDVLALPDGRRVDLLAGDTRAGVIHVDARHPGDLDTLPRHWPTLAISKETAEKIVLDGPGARAVVAKEFGGDPQRWVLTFLRRKGRPRDGTVDSAPNGGPADTSPDRPTDGTVAPARPAGQSPAPSGDPGLAADAGRVLDELGDLDLTLVEQPVARLGLAGVVSRADVPAKVWETEWRRLMDGQPFDTLEELYQLAPRRQDELVAAVEAAAKGTGGAVKNPGFKKQVTAAEKIMRKAYRTPRRLTDIVRAGIVVDAPAQLDAIVRELGTRFRLIDEGWNSTEVGYLDRKVIVVFDDGLLGELQFWPAAMFAAKNDGGQALYTARRTAEARGEDGTSLRAQEAALYAAVRNGFDDEWRRVYSAASAAPTVTSAGGGPKRSTSSAKAASASVSDMRRASFSTSATSTRAQPSSGLSTAAPDGPITASRASQENQRTGDIGETSTSNVRAPDQVGKPPGDPALAAEAGRVLDELGDLDLTLVERTPDGGETVTKVSARQALRDAGEDAAAAAELLDCAGGAAEG